MEQIPIKEELQNFALQFDSEIVRPLIKAGFDRYNIFDILNISRQELRHSDFLAFLFNPNKSGEVGQQFLRNFLTLLSKDTVPELDFCTMLYGNIENINVYREYAVKGGRIDILINLEIEKQKIVIAVENKVDTGEHDNQLGKYKDFLTRGKYKDYQQVLLYLSPDKDEPEEKNSGWRAIDYELIYKVLCRIDTETADNTIKTLVEDYKKTIRREFRMTNDDELKQLAVEIYKNKGNRKVFDYIYKCIPDWREETAKIIHEFLEKKGFEPESTKQNVNIAFRAKELSTHKGFLQICVTDMSLLCINDAGKSSTKWLCGDKQKSKDATERLQENVVSDFDQFKADCKRILEEAFAEDGIISQCLAELKPN